MLNKHKLSKIILILSFVAFSPHSYAAYSDEDEYEYDVEYGQSDFSKSFDFGAESSPPGSGTPPTFDDEGPGTPPTFDDEGPAMPIDHYLLPFALCGVILGAYWLNKTKPY